LYTTNYQSDIHPARRPGFSAPKDWKIAESLFVDKVTRGLTVAMKKTILFSIWTICGLTYSFVDVQAKEPDGAEVAKLCYYKNQGKDQKTKMIFTMRDNDGTVTKTRTFLRFWKDFRGEGDLVSKLMLFTIAPPEYEDNNYLRINYTLTSGKLPEQWLYSRQLHTVQRIANMDQSNLDWGFIAEDLNVRQLDEDTHKLIDTFEKDGSTVYEVESVPKLENSRYGRMVSQYAHTDSWDDCTMRSRDYYDKTGKLIKKATFAWRQIDDVWLLDRANIIIQKTQTEKQRNAKEPPKSVYITYENTEPEVNVGLTDRDFSTRILQRTLR